MSEDIISAEQEPDNQGEGYSMKPKGSPIENIFSELEMFSMHRGQKSLGLDTLNDGQKDKVLDLMHKNEENAIAYHTKVVESNERIIDKSITSSNIDKITKRYGLLAGLGVIGLITILILFFKDQYFSNWLSFLAGGLGGLGGGYSLAKSAQKNDNKPSLPKSGEVLD